MTPGTMLPNGATVVASRGGLGRRTVVLALTNGLAAHPYATWTVDPVSGTATAGDYCLTFEGALRSFAARTGLAIETLTDGTVPPEDNAKDVTPLTERERDEQQYLQACDNVLRGKQPTEPCGEHGHFDCAFIDGGGCTAERISEEMARLEREGA